MVVKVKTETAFAIMILAAVGLAISLAKHNWSAALWSSVALVAESNIYMLGKKLNGR